MPSAFGSNVRRLRKERKMRQREVAAAVGVTVSAVSRWENGKDETARMSHLLALAKLFDLEHYTDLLRERRDS